MTTDPKKFKQFLGEFYFRVKAGDVFNLKQLYTMMHEWFVEEEYCGEDSNFPEEFYLEKRNGKEKNFLIFWNFEKGVFGDEFVKRTVWVEIRINGIKNIEIQHNGTKVKTQKGTVEIKTWWRLTYDPNNEWGSHWFLKHVLDFYVYRMFKKDFEMKRQEVLRDAQAFQAALKEYFNLFSFKSENPDIKRVINLE